MRNRLFTLAACTAVLALPSSVALAGGGGIGTGSGGDDGGGGGGGGGETVPGDRAKLTRSGKAIAPASAPRAVKKAIEAANDIDRYPYKYGGGHRARGYDCSGAVSYVLGSKGAGVLESPMASGGFVNWGKPGKGKWITTYANSGHMFVVIAGLRFDTSQPDDGDSGPGWSKDVQKGFVNVSKNAARHPKGF
jgi:hypothetical protein